MSTGIAKKEALIKSLVQSFDDYMKINLEIFSFLTNPKFSSYIPKFFKEHNGITPSLILGNEEAIKKEAKSKFWNKLIKDSGFDQFLPSNHVDQIRSSYENNENLPDFNIDNVTATLFDWYKDVDKFMAERVRNAFSLLSKEHITNTPEGFFGKMIFSVSISYVDKKPEIKHDNVYALAIHDLRYVITNHYNFQIDSLKNYLTIELLRSIPTNGVWYSVDNGLMEIKRYKKGTIHVRLHDEVCVVLNNYLDHSAIPNKFRKPQKNSKRIDPKGFDDMLSQTERDLIFSFKDVYKHGRYFYVDDFNLPKSTDQNKYSYSNGLRTIESLVLSLYTKKEEFSEQRKSFFGGKRYDYKTTRYYFDFNIKDLLNKIAISGIVPNKKSYQFYPTGDDVKAVIKEYIDKNIGDRLSSINKLEPSCGTGRLADLINIGNLDLVELSSFNVDILKQRGYKNVVQGDFLKYAKQCKSRYDLILMNPPFDGGQAIEHVQTAYELLNSKGIILAVVPATYKKIDHNILWSGSFDYVSIPVKLIEIIKQ